MKRVLSLILLLALCLGLCACSSKAQAEVISVDDLYADLTNAAKCTLNVGKQVTLLGQIQTIGTDHCSIVLISRPNTTVSVAMPVEILAELNVDQFIAVTGIVESYNGGVGYTVSSTQTLDANAMDTIFREIIANKFDNGAMKRSNDFKSHLHILYDYVSSRGDVYKMQDTKALKDYLCRTWDCGRFTYYNPNDMSSSIFEAFDITYNADGSVDYSIYNTWRDDWELNEDGDLQSFFSSKTVYVLSDYAFVCDEYIFVQKH